MRHQTSPVARTGFARTATLFNLSVMRSYEGDVPVSCVKNMLQAMCRVADLWATSKQSSLPMQVESRHCAMRVRIPHSSAICLCLLFLSAPTFAQNSLVGVIGEPPDATEYPIPGVGFVNLNNGNLHMELPLRTVKDRNGVAETTSLVYDNSDFLYIQVPQTSGGTSTGLAAYPGYYPDGGNVQYNEWSSGLRIVTTPSYSGNVMYTATYTQGCNGANQCSSGQVYTNWQYVDGQGTVHTVDSSLQTADSSLVSLGYQTGFQASVGFSGYWMVVSNSTQATVYDEHGSLFTVLRLTRRAPKTPMEISLLDTLISWVARYTCYPPAGR